MLVVVLVLIGLVVLAAAWLRYGRDQRASVFILSDGDFSAPELRMGGRLIELPNVRGGPWRHYAWADLRPRLAVTEIEVSWTGTDGRRRTLRDLMHHGYEGSAPHCAYLLRLDSAGDPVPALPGGQADQLLSFCHY